MLRSEAIRESMPDFYARAVADTLIDPIGQPDINITAARDEGPLTFEAEVEVRPEVAIDRPGRLARDDSFAQCRSTVKSTPRSTASARPTRS